MNTKIGSVGFVGECHKDISKKSWLDRLEDKSLNNNNNKPNCHPLSAYKTYKTPLNRQNYRFMLNNDEGGGVYISSATTIIEARRELEKKYGTRLSIAVKATDR